MAQIHVRLEIGVERPDVTPVLRRLLVLVVEAVRVDRRRVDERGNDVLAEIVRRRLVRVRFERVDEHVGVEDVDAHRRQREIG